MVFYGVRDGRICITSDGVSVKSVKGLREGQTCGVIDRSGISFCIKNFRSTFDNL